METFTVKGKQGTEGLKKYMNYITEVKQYRREVIPVSLEDLANSQQSALVNNITKNAMRYVELFEDAVDSILPTIRVYEEPTTPADILNVGVGRMGES